MTCSHVQCTYEKTFKGTAAILGFAVKDKFKQSCLDSWNCILSLE